MVRLARSLGLALLLVLAGCSGESQSTSSVASVPPAPCTLMGCQSGVTIELAESLPDGEYEATICIDDYCGTNTVMLSGSKATYGSGSEELWVSPKGDRISLWSNTGVSREWSEGVEGVSLTIADLGSGVVIESAIWSDVRFASTQPNGPDCPPVCFQARLAT